jgi:hypothetical protein
MCFPAPTKSLPDSARVLSPSSISQSFVRTNPPSDKAVPCRKNIPLPAVQ